MRKFKFFTDFDDYCALFEDSGWKHIAGSKRSGMQYFRKTGGGVSEDIFSDIDSKAGRYKRLSAMWISMACVFIPIFAVMISTEAIDAGAIWNPRLLYYTPGLWEETGTTFWKAFFLETPFAFFRGLIWLFIPAMIVLYAIFALKADKHYKLTQYNKDEN